MSYSETLNRSAFKGKGCKNDEARSGTLCYARAGTVIRMYDSPYFYKTDDWFSIKVNSGMSGCVTIDTFSEDFNANGVEGTSHYMNGIDGKVSAMQIDVRYSNE